VPYGAGVVKIIAARGAAQLRRPMSYKIQTSERVLEEPLDKYDIELVRQFIEVKLERLPESTEELKAKFFEVLENVSTKVYFMMSASSRLGRMSLPLVVSLVGSIVCFVIWLAKIPPIHLSALLTTAAYSAPLESPVDPYKPYIMLAIFVVLVGTFILSIWVLFFKKLPSTGALQFADFMAKGLFGVFVGAFATYLGIKP
jgi:hypothetical protein